MWQKSVGVHAIGVVAKSRVAVVVSNVEVLGERGRFSSVRGSLPSYHCSTPPPALLWRDGHVRIGQNERCWVQVHGLSLYLRGVTKREER